MITTNHESRSPIKKFIFRGDSSAFNLIDDQIIQVNLSMMVLSEILIKDTEKWANNLFSNAELGDKRRTKRLVTLAHQIASHTGSSIVKASGSQASIEGAYRFLRKRAIHLAFV